ncbi:MotE family protein [Sedimentitalea sp. HM32M-2]|uniref:MotE family protein n=1 Tax=Sedimentitalea sp. HM32M-2 TaxID=3351566 RepID=UPI00363F46E2
MSRKPDAGRKRRVRGSALLVISLLMIGSASLRVGLQAGPAIARDSPKPDQPEESRMETAIPGTPAPAELQSMLAAFQKREETLQIRETQIEDRFKALEIAERAINERLAALQAAEQQLTATLAIADVASEEDLTRLTSVYEKMKPKQSAALFEEMDPEFAAGFLARMRPEAAAGIMAGLSPMAAYTISVVLAGRNASVPKE